MCNNTTDLKIYQIFIHALRGIPHELSLDLRSESSSVPRSLIILGDNGSGKSSIVDAVEFALQARIAREQQRFGEDIPSAFSFARGRGDWPLVRISLSDGSQLERSFFVDGNGKLQLTSTLPHPDFSISPFVLRRSDILRFNQTPESKRQTVFFDYLRLPAQLEREEAPTESEQRLLQERSEEKGKRRELIAALAQKFGVPVENIPLDIRRFNQFLRQTEYRKISEKDASLAIEAEMTIKAIIASSRRIRSLDNQIARLRRSVSGGTPKSILGEVLAKVSDRLTKAFLEISASTFIDAIELIYGRANAVSLSMKVHLRNGKRCAPKEILSEANLDLLALLMFLAVTKESAERGQAKLIILDDVLQSVDATIRVSIVDYILREFSDWQLIVTAHDRLWQNQLRELCRRHSHPFIEREIVRWSFDSGPVILEAKDIDWSLEEALDHGNVMYICSQSGLLLEAVCNRLSWVLPISVVRRKDDKYTLGDLWPGVQKVLRKTNVQEVVLEVDKWLHLRNLAGAHYNEWAQSISTQEVRLFGEAILRLFASVRCSKCFHWIASTSKLDQQWVCRCGQTIVKTA
jgi:hypothetical protein